MRGQDVKKSDASYSVALTLQIDDLTTAKDTQLTEMKTKVATLMVMQDGPWYPSPRRGLH